MGYQKIINLLDNTPTQPTKFKTKNWVAITAEARGTYNKDRKLNLKLLCWIQVYVIIMMRMYL